MYRGHWGILLDEHGVFESAPISRLWVVLGSRSRMLLKDNRMVVHVAKFLEMVVLAKQVLRNRVTCDRSPPCLHSTGRACKAGKGFEVEALRIWDESGATRPKEASDEVTVDVTVDRKGPYA
jgi:hypothetical protein